VRAVLVCVLTVVAGCSRSGDDPFAGSVGARGSAAAAASEPTVVITPPADALAGADAITHVMVTPPAGFHVNDAYPVKLELAPVAGVALARTTLEAGDAGVELDREHLAMAIHVTPTAGTHTVAGKLSVGFCGATSCITRHLPVAVTIAAR
jgi:hypothetical protein